MYQLCFYVPESHCEAVKEALFAKGAGRYKNYAACCWQTLGEGQFMPLAESAPFIGSQGKLEKVDELLDDVLSELKRVHPYEEPAFSIWTIQIDVSQ